MKKQDFGMQMTLPTSQPDFDQACTTYFTQPSTSHPLHALLTTPLSPTLVTQLLSFARSSNLYTTQFISRLLAYHIQNGTSALNIPFCIQQIFPLTQYVGSAYAPLYAALLLASWRASPAAITPDVNTLCNMTDQCNDIGQKQALFSLLTTLVNEFAKTKSLPVAVSKTFKEQSLIRITETVVATVFALSPTDHHHLAVLATALETFSTVLEAPFISTDDEVIILQIPSAFAEILGNAAFRERLHAFFVPGAHVRQLLQTCISLASIRETLFFGAQRAAYAEYLSRTAALLCRFASNEDTTHLASVFLKRLILLRRVPAAPFFADCLALFERVVRAASDNTNALFNLLYMYARWVEAYPCAADDRPVIREAVQRVVDLVVQLYLGSADVPEDAADLVDDFGVIGRMDYQRTAELIVARTDALLAETTRLCAAGVGAAAACRILRHVADAVLLVRILLENQVPSKADQNDERLDVVLFALVMRVVAAEPHWLRTLGAAPELTDLELHVLDTMLVIRQCIYNDSVSRNVRAPRLTRRPAAASGRSSPSRRRRTSSWSSSARP